MDNSLQKIDQFIRTGSREKAISLLSEFKISSLPRSSLVSVANLFRRVQMYQKALLTLRKPIKDEIDLIDFASPQEKIEYSHSLVKLGFLNEAFQWVNEISEKKFPDILDLKARIYIAQWNYEKAGKYLQRYSNTIDKNSYKSLVNAVNLGACYIGTSEYEKSQKHLKKIIEVADRTNQKLILGNCYELLAQSQILSGQITKSLDSLDKCGKIFGKQSGIYSFYEKKWRWVIKLKQGGATRNLIEESLFLKSEASQLKHWEDCRDIERRLAIAQHSREGILKIYFGTIHGSFRESLLRDWGGEIVIPSEYVWVVSGKKKDLNPFDINQSLKSGGFLNKLFTCLTHDFFRPLSLGYIFSQLYPDEYMDPIHSPQRIYKLTRRLGIKLSERNFPGQVNWTNDGIQLSSEKALSIKIYLEKHLGTREEEKIKLLRSKLRQNWFTTKQVAEMLDVSQRSARQTIKNSKDQYKIEMSGKGKNIRYRFSG